MRRPIVAGNWKMHGSQALLEAFAAEAFPGPVETLVFPPAVYVAEAVRRLSGIGVGIQDVHPETVGAFTGEVAAEMAAELGATHALVGHSERRQLFGEDNGTVAKKYAAAQRAGLVPILCVGETLEERRAGRQEAVVLSQLHAVFGSASARNAVVAYEPVWAIGTGETATPAQAQAMHAIIREALGEPSLRILYGGSVKPENAAALFGEEDVDGGLVGGASLSPAAFKAIAAAAVL
ncbi:MAG: triose-phosphate isomerase [Gammaproteobacteria bacterium]|nr:triose-phosphate isomerase [Gammaproteobacteria bacterium]